MPTRVLLTSSGLSLLFLIAAGVIVGFSVVIGGVRNKPNPQDGTEAARHLIYRQFPLEAGIANAVLMFFTFLVVLPGLLTPSRGLLKVGLTGVAICGLYTMSVGVFLWVLTLRTRVTLEPVWKIQDQSTQALLEDSFLCCGFINSTSPAFTTTESVCPSPAAAALMRGCAGPLSAFANELLNDAFNVIFSIVGVDALLILALACLLKDRKERERYRHIDEKSGVRRF